MYQQLLLICWPSGRPQPITLASGCWTPGIVDHEIGKQGVNPGSSLI